MTEQEIQAHNMRINAKVIACQIRSEGMKAENAQRDRQNYAQAYGDDQFEALATEVEQLALMFIGGPR